MNVSYSNNLITFTDVSCFDLARSCDCGQAFRWKPMDGGWFGVAGDKGVLVKQEGSTVTVFPAEESHIGFWINYFDFARDYRSIEDEVRCNSVLSPCVNYASGIHIFNQEPFETLISFIISANNNIKRISGIIDRLCALAGEKHEGDIPYYSFPKPEAIAALTEEQLFAIGSGYRAPYIKKSAAMAAAGFDLNKLIDMPTEKARKELLAFPGVGPKVADCVLLFSLRHSDAFPMDVWMKRAMRLLYFGDREPCKKELEAKIASLGPNSGILQQYIFHYARENM